MPGSRHTPGLVDVLEADRDTVHRSPVVSRHNLRFCRARSGERLIAEQPDKAVELAVDLLDAREAAFNKLHWREFALADQRARLRDSQEFGDHAFTPPAAAGRRARVRRPSSDRSVTAPPFPR